MFPTTHDLRLREDKDKDKNSAKASDGKHDKEEETPTVRPTDGSLIAGLLGLSDDGKSQRSEGSDRLNLSGLLNVLDGVIDAPGRIVIMTTNRPEKLDPALVRPGRVNKKLLLGYMGVTEVQEMIEYCFNTRLSGEETRRLSHVMSRGGVQWTPAEIEEFCAEFDTVEEILSHCEEELEESAASLSSSSSSSWCSS